MTGQEAVRWTVFGVSITDTGHGFVGTAKLIEHSLTTVISKERKRECYALCQNGELASYKRLTQLIRRRRPVGGQDGPNLTLFVIFVERGSPTFSPICLVKANGIKP